MKLISLLDHLAAAPADQSAAPRRAVLRQVGSAALAALPLGLGASLPAAADTKDTSYDAVTQLLLLERLQRALYTRALAAPGLIPLTQLADFQRLRLHQDQHVAFLTEALQAAGAIVPTEPAFDFSGRRGVVTNPVLFPNVLSNFDDFLALAQQLEDLGVRLYKTQAFNITNDSQLLKAVLRIHAVEAQHSAHVRSLRRGRGVAVKNWPSDTDAAIVRPAAAQVLTTAATGGEENPIQNLKAGMPIPFANFLLIRDNTAVRDSALSEAFDEPLTTTVAQAALNLFV
ncbi:ferritin-like domain-containing protein [Hymenobacter terrenus]|uniref:ferritin-like domain-containing protein n=1 Tax=Hymenobacter terrenus TaxID=1629124 RepID=UPI000697D734|nr:ferritin-like domain-containing protein [Hymenobacter terrenus]